MMEIYLNMISGDLLMPMLMIIKKRLVMERMIRAPSLDLGPDLAVKRNHVAVRVQVHQDLEVGVEIKRKRVKVENLDPPVLHHPPAGPDREAKSDPLADLDPLNLVKRSGHAPAQGAIKRRAGGPGHPQAPAAAGPVDPDQGIGQERSANKAMKDVTRLKQTIMHHTVARYIRHLLAETAIKLLINLNIEICFPLVHVPKLQVFFQKMIF